METTERAADGRFYCITAGCRNPPRAKTKPGLCNACDARTRYREKRPDAARLPTGYWGKHKGKTCAWDNCDKPAVCKGFCGNHYAQDRTRQGIVPPSANPGARRNARLKSRYGISLKDYDSMVEDQKGLCAVCGEPPSSENTRAHWGGKLCVDHCHEAEKGGPKFIRGLLCNDCNLAAGYAKTPQVARALADYLERHDGLHDGPDSDD